MTLSPDCGASAGAVGKDPARRVLGDGEGHVVFGDAGTTGSESYILFIVRAAAGRLRGASCPAPATTCFLLYDPTKGEAHIYRWSTTGGEVGVGVLFTGWRKTWNLVATTDGAVLFHDAVTGHLYCFHFTFDGGTVGMSNGWGGTAGPATRGGAAIVCHPTQIVPVSFSGTEREVFFYLPTAPLT